MTGLYEAVHRIVGERVEGNLESFAMTDANASVFVPATDAEIVNLILGSHYEEVIEEQPREIPTVAQAQDCLQLLRNQFECSGCGRNPMLCLNELEQALLAPDRSTQHSKLSAFFLCLNKGFFS